LVADNVLGRYNFETTLYDASGNMLWNWYLDKDGQAGYTSSGRAMAVDAAGNPYLTGWRYIGDVCLTLKLTNGHKAWIPTYRGSAAGQNQGNAITLDSAGNAYVPPSRPATATP